MPGPPGHAPRHAGLRSGEQGRGAGACGSVRTLLGPDSCAPQVPPPSSQGSEVAVLQGLTCARLSRFSLLLYCAQAQQPLCCSFLQTPNASAIHSPAFPQQVAEGGVLC